MRIFQNRDEAGIALAAALREYSGQPDVVVLALPRGGVPVARAVAGELGVPFDVLLVRKLGVPWQPELAFGAICEGGTHVVNQSLIQACRLTPAQIETAIAEQERELERRARVFRGTRPPAEVAGRTVIIVDDGLATGSTMQAAVRAMRGRGAGKVIVAVPVGPAATCATLAAEADRVICLDKPEPFEAVGEWYADFHQMTDEEVRELLV